MFNNNLPLYITPSQTITQTKHSPTQLSAAIIISSADECLVVFQQSLQYMSIRSFQDVCSIDYVITNSAEPSTINGKHHNNPANIAEYSQFTTALQSTIRHCTFSGIGLHSEANRSLLCIITSTYHTFILIPHIKHQRIDLLIDLTGSTQYDADNKLSMTSLCCDWLQYTVTHDAIQYTYIAIGNQLSTVSVYQIQLPITSQSIPQRIASINLSSHTSDTDACIHDVKFNPLYQPNDDSIAQLAVSLSNGMISICTMQHNINNHTYYIQQHQVVCPASTELSYGSCIEWHTHGAYTYLFYNKFNELYVYNINSKLHIQCNSQQTALINTICPVIVQDSIVVFTSHDDGSINQYILSKSTLSLNNKHQPNLSNDQQQISGAFGIALSRDKLCTFALYRTNDKLNKHSAALSQTYLLLTPTPLLNNQISTVNNCTFTTDRADLIYHDYQTQPQTNNQSTPTRKRVKSESVNFNTDVAPGNTTNQSSSVHQRSDRAKANQVGSSRIDAAKQTLRSINNDPDYYLQHSLRDSDNQRTIERTQYQHNVIMSIFDYLKSHGNQVMNFYTIQQYILLSCFYVPDINHSTGNVQSSFANSNSMMYVFSSTFNQMHANNIITQSPIATITWFNFQRVSAVEYVELGDVLLQCVKELIQSYIDTINSNTVHADTSIIKLRQASILCYIAGNLQAPYVSLLSEQQRLLYRYKGTLQTYLCILNVQHKLQPNVDRTHTSGNRKLSILLMCDWILQRHKLHTSTLLNRVIQIYKQFNCESEMNIAVNLQSNTNTNVQLHDMLYYCIDNSQLTVSHTSTIELPAREQCYICDVPVSFTGLSKQQCNNGHKLLRCAKSFQLITNMKLLQHCTNCIASYQADTAQTKQVCKCTIDDCYIVLA